MGYVLGNFYMIYLIYDLEYDACVFSAFLPTKIGHKHWIPWKCGYSLGKTGKRVSD